ncbi:MAG: cyclic pyranopterin monophosphate synthase MoaC [Spirochaetaceae bacterium]|jgi:cyclic pyranopterin phosphate synthase|nr:cyclic pyranopterin monophosphate synthase MoaC [Spirochaetaceae bacterium]
MDNFTHFDKNGNAVMVDVGGKEISRREAVAKGIISLNKNTLAAIKSGGSKKGDVLGAARIAGIMAAKKTAELIPLCHTLVFDSCAIDFNILENSETDEQRIESTCAVKLSGKTGAEMEALTGVSVSLLTIYDMCKALERGMVISNIRLEEKSGGKSGLWPPTSGFQCAPR